MRELLTVLAGLVLLVLVAALAVPGFVDWGQHRAEIERRLSDAVGIEVVTTGPIELALLPSPRIAIDGVRLGDADPAGTRAVVGRLTAELSLGPLLRGEARFSELLLDRAEIAVVAAGGTLTLPRRWDRTALPTSVARVELTRSRLLLTQPDASPSAVLPLALVATTPGPGGPLRIEGEVAGRSVRVTTGDSDPTGAVRMKAIIAGPGFKHDFDGAFGAVSEAGRIAPRLAGRLAIAPTPGEDGQPVASLSAQVEASRGGIRLASLIVDAPGVGRLDGEAIWDAPSSFNSVPALVLKARRLDAGAAIERWPTLQGALEREGWLKQGALLPPALRVDLVSEQLTYRGEEATGAAVTALLRADGRHRVEAAALEFAGMRLAVSPGASATAPLQATLQSGDLRRLALALQRLGVDTGLAEDLASLRDLTVTADVPAADLSAMSSTQPVRWQAHGHFGRAEGLLRQAAGGAVHEMTLHGVDLMALARPAQALARLVATTGLGRASELQIRSDTARLGDSPPGTLRLAAHLGAGGASLRRLQLNGFDGVTIAFDEPAQGGGASLISLSAVRADAIGQLVARLTGDPALARALVSLKGLSPVRLDGSLRLPAEAGGRGEERELALSGRIGAMEASVNVATRHDSRLGGLAVRLDGERAVLFRALGLPSPLAAREPTQLVLRRDGATADNSLRLALELTGADGFSLSASGLAVDEAGVWRAPFRLVARRMAAALPAFAVPQGDDRALQADGGLTIRADGVALDGLTARLGQDSISGALAWRPEGALSGRLALPSIDLARLAREVIGPAPLVDAASGQAVWSGARFLLPQAQGALPELDLAITSAAIEAGEAGRWQGAFRLGHAAGLIRLSEASLVQGERKVSGTASLERQGAQVALRATGTVTGLPLAELTGAALIGQADLDLQVGATGESPARLAANLSGTVEARLGDVVMPRFAPDALDRIAAAALTDTVLEDAAQLATNVRRQVESAPWAFGAQTTSGVMSGGLLRFAPIGVQREGRAASVTVLQDIRNRGGEIRAVMALEQAPRGWMGPAPQLTVLWRGPWAQSARTYDVSTLANALSQRALQREINRVEAMEADIRERSLFNRRLRTDRETDRREAEQRAMEERAAQERAAQERAAQERAAQESAAREQAVRDGAAAAGFNPSGGLPHAANPQQGLAPPLPPALMVPTLPAPLSRPSLN